MSKFLKNEVPKSQFLTELVLKCCPTNENLWQLEEDLSYQSDMLRDPFSSNPMSGIITIKAGFWTDLASTRHIPLVSFLWGSTAHREAVLHDYLNRLDSIPVVSFAMGNSLFAEAMECRKKKPWVRWPMFWGVWIGGYFSYHERKVNWQPSGTSNV